MNRCTFRIGGSFSSFAQVYFGTPDGSKQELRVSMERGDPLLVPPPGAFFRMSSSRPELEIRLGSQSILRLRWTLVSIPERPREFPPGAEEILAGVPAGIRWVERAVEPHLRISLTSNLPWFFVTDREFSEALLCRDAEQDEEREVAFIARMIIGDCSLHSEAVAVRRAMNIALTLHRNRGRLGEQYPQLVTEAASAYPELEGWGERMMALPEAA